MSAEAMTSNQELLSAGQTWLERMRWETRTVDHGRLQARRTPDADWRYVTAHTPVKVEGLHYFVWTNEVVHVCRKDEQYQMVTDLQRRSGGQSFAGVPILWVEGDQVVEAWNVESTD